MGKAILVLFACLVIAGVVSVGPALLRFTGSCGRNQPVSDQWSSDRAFDASVLKSHCTGGWMSPDYDIYTVQIEALPGHHPRKNSLLPDYADYGWSRKFPFFVEEPASNPVMINWHDSRLLYVIVETSLLQGELIRRTQDLAIETYYVPRPR